MLANLYRVEASSIKGGMGSVYRVRHVEWDVDLAMKRPYQQLFTSAKSRAQFMEECSALDQAWHSPEHCGLLLCPRD